MWFMLFIKVHSDHILLCGSYELVMPKGISFVFLLVADERGIDSTHIEAVVEIDFKQMHFTTLFFFNFHAVMWMFLVFTI